MRYRNLLRSRMENCYHCGDYVYENVATCDHFIPISKKGTNSFINCVLSCSSCNKSFGNVMKVTKAKYTVFVVRFNCICPVYKRATDKKPIRNVYLKQGEKFVACAHQSGRWKLPNQYFIHVEDALYEQERIDDGYCKEIC